MTNDEDEFVTRYFDGESCPECGEENGLEEKSDDDETYLECKACGAISNNGKRGEGHTFI